MVIARTGFPAPTPPPAPPAERVPPTPAPYDPEQDPALRQKLAADYRDGTRQVERRAPGMGYNEGRSYRRTKTQELLVDLAEKYELKVDQVKRITTELTRRE